MQNTYMINAGQPMQPVPAVQNVSLLDAQRWNTIFQSNGTASSGVNVNHKTAIGYPPLWRAISLISNDVAGLPLDVYRRTENNGREVARSHSAEKLVKYRASSIMRACVFRKTLTAHALLFGNGFAWIERNSLRQPVALWVLDPQNMIIRYMEEDDQLWYCTYINGEPVKFPAMEVLHIRGLGHDGIRGYSILDIMQDALGVGMAAQDFGGRFFGQGSNMSGLLMIPGAFSDEKIRNTMDAWNSMNAGLKNSHKVGLLQDGVRFQQLTVNPEQAQFLQTRQFEVRATVANIIGVPPHLLGDDTRTSHSSLEQENLSYLQRSLNPWLKEWESECNEKLLSEREKERDTHFVEFNREAEVQMIYKDKIDGIYRQMEMGLISANEGRRLLNLSDLGEDGDIRYRPANWLEVGEEPAPAAVPMTQSDDEPQEDAADDVNLAALRQMVTASAGQAVKIEADRVKRASKSASNFLNWVESFYATWIENSLAGLESDAVTEIKAKHAAESKLQILDVAGTSTADSLPNNIAEMSSTWGDRVPQLVDQVIKAIR